MSQAVICPICKGSGKLRKVDGLILADDAPGIKGMKIETCHGCGGMGWIEIGKNNWDFPVFPTPIYPIQPYQPPYITYITWSGSDSNQ